MIEGGIAKGVEMEDGREFLANKLIASSLDPLQTFLRLIEKKHLDKEFIEKIEGWKWGKWSLFGVHLVLDEAPKFSVPAADQAFIIVMGYVTQEDLIDHWKAVEEGRLLKEAGFHCSFPSIHDRSPGQTRL